MTSRKLNQWNQSLTKSLAVRDCLDAHFVNDIIVRHVLFLKCSETRVNVWKTHIILGLKNVKLTGRFFYNDISAAAGLEIFRELLVHLFNDKLSS